MSNKLNETFKKHLKLLHEHLNEIGDPENDTISARLDNWLDQNSSGYDSSFKVDTFLNDLDIEKGTPAFNELVDAFKERSFELKGNQFVKTTKKGSGVSDEVVKDTANQYIKHFGKGSYSLENSAKDFASLSQGGGDPDVRSNFPNWSDENFKQLLDILYTNGGLKRPVDETFQKHLGLLRKKLNEGNDNLVSMIERYVEIIETLASISLSRDGGDPDLEDEKKQIKNQIISSKGQEYFNMVDEFVELKVRKGNQSEVESLANQLGLPQLALSEVTTEGNEPSGLKQLVPITLKGATVIDVMTSSDGKVHLRLKGSNSTQLYDAILV
jgi:hypothetical protein